MARRVLADFDAELTLRLANRSDITSTQRGFFLQDAYKSICNRFVHKELQATTTGTITAATDYWTPSATDIWWPEMLRNVTDGYLIDIDDKENIENATKQSGQPHRFYWFGGTFYFEAKPTVNTSVKLWYVMNPIEFTVSPLIDQIFDSAIIMLAAVIGLNTVRDFAEAHIQDVQYNNYVTEHKLPLRQAKLIDHRTGLKVRFS